MCNCVYILYIYTYVCICMCLNRIDGWLIGWGGYLLYYMLDDVHYKLYTT